MLLFARVLQRRGRQASQPAPEGSSDSEITAASSGQDAATGNGSPGGSPPVEPCPSPPRDTAQAAAIPATAQISRARPPIARPPIARPPRPPIRSRLQQMAGSVESFVVRHRTSSALIFAYCSFFWRLYEEAGKLVAVDPGPVPVALTSGTTFLDSDGEAPLTRADVLSRARLAGADSGRRVGAGLRRESAEKFATAEGLEDDEDAITLLERALGVATSEKDPQRRAQLISESYAALGRIHSARGHYYEMLHAMSLALRTRADTGDVEAISNLQIALGYLELKHHRYFAAGTRFEDALQTGQGTGVSNATRAEALAGLGWTALVQGSGEVASSRFLEALGWAPAPLPPNVPASTAAATAVVTAAREGCRARHDGLDGVRALSLAGLSLASSRSASSAVTAGGLPRSGHPATLIQCAVLLFHGLPADLQEAHIWHALGLARHSLTESASAKHYHQRAALRERRDPSLVAAHPGDVTCATAADLPSCSYSALHLGLVDFSAGNASLGAGHVELLLSRVADAIPAEAAEWLTRFARAHAWAPAGRDFAAFLLGRVEPLLKAEGEGRMARHFREYGRFLLAHRDRPTWLKRALTQLGRAQAIVERTDVGWPDGEVAALYSTMGAVQHQVGEIEEAVRSFEKAIDYDRRSASAGGRQNLRRLLMSHANLGAARLQLAGTDPRRWTVALKDLRDGRRTALEAGLTYLDPIMKELEASIRNAERLAHHRGMLATCPGPLDALLYGPSCPAEAQ